MLHIGPAMEPLIAPNASYTAEQVARLLFHCSLRTFKRHKKRRVREGFPGPISQHGRQLWSGAALIAWRDRGQIAAASRTPVIDFSALLASRARRP